MKRSIFVAAVAAFLAGLAVGRYTLPQPPPVKESVPGSADDSLGTTPTAPIFTLSARATPAKNSSQISDPDPASTEAIIAALRNAMARPSDRHGRLEINKLIDGIDPKNVRPVIDRLQTLPNQRDKSVYVSLLIARWAEGEPLAALAYAQTTGTASDRKIAVSSAVPVVWA